MRPSFSSTQLDSSSINVLNWNVCKGKRNNWKSDFKKLSKKHDIILIQEAYLNQKMLDALEIDGMGWNFATSFMLGRDQIPTGVLTASNTWPVASNFLRTRYFEPILKTPKVSLLTQYQLSGSTSTLLVVNVHAINFVGLKAFNSQLEDLEDIVRGFVGPMIFAGDFNTWKKERMDLLLGLTDRLNLNSVQFNPDGRTKMLGNALDHIFYSGLEIKSYNVLQSVGSSDHKPITVEFTLE